MGRKNKLTKHHRLPRSKGGNGDDDNIVQVPQEKHDAYHTLFGTDDPEVVLVKLMDTWFPPNYFRTIAVMKENGKTLVLHADPNMRCKNDWDTI